MVQKNKSEKTKKQKKNNNSKKSPKLELSRLKKNSFIAGILNVFTANPLKPFNYRQISSQLGVEDKASRELIKNMLADLKSVEAIVEISRGKYQLNPELAEQTATQGAILKGKIEMKRNGKAYVLVDGQDEDIYIAPGNTHTAFNGDTVKVRLFPKRKDKKLEGQVIEIIERERTQFVGILQRQPKYAFVVLDLDNSPSDFFVPLEDIKDAQNGEKVVVELVDWPDKAKNPVGKVVEVLGKPGENNVEMMSILVNNSFPTHFPSHVEHEAEKISTVIPEEEIRKRRDFRNVTTFTIDPIDAKDFDDALSIEFLSDSVVEVGVHIADVSHYVKPLSVIDKEAFYRATSVYLVDRTIPMLPEALSNNLCSLQPNQDKLCFSAVFQLDKNAKILSQWFGKTIIHSDRRFAYEEAQEIIEGKSDEYSKSIITLDALAKKLREERFKKGAIDFGSEEVKFKLDEQGKPIEVFIKESKDSNKLIEEFMLLANRKVAEFITTLHRDKKTGQFLPFVYRIHDKPNEAKLQQFSDFLKKIGYKLNLTNEKTISTSLNKLFQTISGKAEENMISTIAVRTMAKAIYSTNNIGHYGLAFENYTHFTSPIRRYPDLMVHRLLFNYLEKSESNNPSKAVLEDNCKHCSEMEKRAADAERDSTKLKQMEYMVGFIGKTCSGVISGVSKWGLFVEVDVCKGEGLVRLEDLKDDFYFLDEDNYQVLGYHNGKAYKLGDPVKVIVKKVDLQQKQMDLTIDE